MRAHASRREFSQVATIAVGRFPSSTHRPSGSSPTGVVITLNDYLPIQTRSFVGLVSSLDFYLLSIYKPADCTSSLVRTFVALPVIAHTFPRYESFRCNWHHQTASNNGYIQSHDASAYFHTAARVVALPGYCRYECFGGATFLCCIADTNCGTKDLSNAESSSSELPRFHESYHAAAAPTEIASLCS